MERQGNVIGQAAAMALNRFIGQISLFGNKIFQRVAPGGEVLNDLDSWTEDNPDQMCSQSSFRLRKI